MGKKVCALAAVFVFVACFGNRTASGDVFSAENRAEILFGKGVHAFFSGEYQEAVSLLDGVEKLESEDPRPYFYLGLAYRRLGKNDDADKYFKKAAKLEWEGRSARDYKVSDALRRIQGRERLSIEEYRKQARLDWQKEEKRKQEILYGDAKAKDREIVATMAKPVVGVAPFGARSVNPFASVSPVGKAVAESKTESKAEVKKETATPAASKKNEDDDSFGDAKDEKDEEKMDDEEDPFADSTDTKKTDAKKTEADDDEDDPFQ